MSRNKKGNIHENKIKSALNGLDSSNDSDSDSTPEIANFSVEDIDQDDQDNQSYKPLSDIRKYNTPLLSEQNQKYRGEVSRRASPDSDDNSVPSASYIDVEFQHGNANTDPDDDDEEPDSDAGTVGEDKDLHSVNTNQEVEKAVCVKNQLTVWEKLLEVRIHSQKILNKANNLPCSKEFDRLASQREFATPAQNLKHNLEGLLEKLIETKVALGNQFSEIKQLGLKKPKNAKEYELTNKSNFKRFEPYRNSVLLKWEDRTKLLASQNAGKKKAPLERMNIVKNISNHLVKMNDLVTQTRTIKAINQPSEKKQTDAEEDKNTQQEISNVDVYDDTDFYHSQLRELIEYKTNASASSYELNSQFSELQKLRQKMKKKVDTRASKGRKIRYVVHNKLINFMGSKCSSNWTEESKSELYKSLFLT